MIKFHGISVVGLRNVSDRFYDQKLEERTDVLDRFFGLFSQEVVGAQKLESLIIVPSSLHIFARFFTRLGMVQIARRYQLRWDI